MHSACRCRKIFIAQHGLLINFSSKNHYCVYGSVKTENIPCSSGRTRAAAALQLLMTPSQKSAAKKSAGNSSSSKSTSEKSSTKKAPAEKTVTGTKKNQNCWPGYEPVPGKKPGTKGSCQRIPGKHSAATRRATQKFAAASKLGKQGKSKPNNI
jgi:hypothetical protein